MNHSMLVRTLAIATFALCLCVVVLGAYVRLSNAGLGCPDWPGCYGHLTPSGAASDAHTLATPLAGRVLNVGKAWREMIHRYAAGTLATLIVVLALMTTAWRRERIVALWYTLALAGIVLVQAILGALTVTRQLKPLIVTAHLLFGFATLCLLWWLTLTLWWQRAPAHAPPRQAHFRPDSGSLRLARTAALLGLCALVVQIALGGWTSSNYAAIACPDLPTCQGSWWPKADFQSAYVLWRDLNVDYTGGVLDNPARVAIHLTHRLGAMGACLCLLLAALTALRVQQMRSVRGCAWALLAALGLQLLIGINMVWRGFPLWLATAHNAGAALLLLATLGLCRALRPIDAIRT
jgi:cytochrome c oxidase assembly protein subunit 15